MTHLRPVLVAQSSPVEPSDDDLMLLVVANDHRAFRILVDRHQLRIRRFLVRMVGPSDADDLAQDVFLKLYALRGSYVASGRFLPFLFRVARNRAHNHTRWRRLRTLFSGDDHAARAEDKCALDAHPTASQLAILIDRQRSHLVQSLVVQMKPSLREVFVLRFVEELDYASIASIVGISEDNARARAHRAFTWLRERAETLEGS